MAVLLGYASLRWGAKALGTAITTTVPILIVVIWLYGLIHLMGFSLNIVTVTIATLSLGVGIDYCIHVVERYRETRANGGDHEQGLTSIGGACAGDPGRQSLIRHRRIPGHRNITHGPVLRIRIALRR